MSLHEAIDTTTAMGEAMFGMCAVFAQLEASLARAHLRGPRRGTSAGTASGPTPHARLRGQEEG